MPGTGLGIIWRGVRTMVKKRGFTTNVTLILAVVLLVFAYIRIQNQYRDGVLLSTKTEEMYERSEHMRSSCSQMPPQRNLRANVQGREFYISEKYSLSYCRVANSGSAFWTQVFMSLAGIKAEFHDYGARSVFDMAEDKVKQTIQNHAGFTMEWQDKRLKLTTSFLVATNPYARLFTSYIDHIYLLNRWTAAVKMVGTPKRQECGIDITFDEFLGYISDNLLNKKQTHIEWAPIFTTCLPCETNINIVAKEESFAKDIDFILEYVGVEESVRRSVREASERTRSSQHVPSLIHRYVSKGHELNRGCISEEALAERVWKAFQIHGFIHNSLTFPKDKFSSIFRDDLEETLVKFVLEAIADTKFNSEGRNAQKQYWKLHFWKMVSKETLLKVQAAYYDDFLLFKYDIDPNTM